MIFTMGMEFEIRRAESDDVPAIALVSYQTWQHTYRGMISEEKINSRTIETIIEKWRQILSLPLPKAGTLVAFHDESIIAYSRFYPSRDIDDDHSAAPSLNFKTRFPVPSFIPSGARIVTLSSLNF